jgi:hypothetical protein
MYRCGACLVLADVAASTLEECPLWGGLSEFVERANDELGYWRRDDEFVEPFPSPRDNRRLWDAR